MIRVLDARFLATATADDHYPAPSFPEIAFVGRSNVGKSSMINCLTGRRKLVRVSKTPGRTRAINFFDVDLEVDGARESLRLADLPGYGYAKVSKGEREGWEKMITTYLKKRQILKVVVSIVDAEVGALPADLVTLDYLAQANAQLLVVATKIDRLPKAKRKPALLALAGKLDLKPEMVLPFSSVEGWGLAEAWEALLQGAWVG